MPGWAWGWACHLRSRLAAGQWGMKEAGQNLAKVGQWQEKGVTPPGGRADSPSPSFPLPFLALTGRHYLSHPATPGLL